jgi:hypothetical protein
VLDDIERGRFLVKPAGKGPLPLLVRPLDVELDERAGELLRFPRRGRLAGAQTDDHVLPARRLAGVQGDILDDAVTLVEDAEHRDALRHRGDSGLVHARRPRNSVAGDRGGRILLLAPAAACRKAQQARRQQ